MKGRSSERIVVRYTHLDPHSSSSAFNLSGFWREKRACIRSDSAELANQSIDILSVVVDPTTNAQSVASVVDDDTAAVQAVVDAGCLGSPESQKASAFQFERWHQLAR